MAKIIVKDTDITVLKINEADYISLTDIAKSRDTERTDYIIQNWMRLRNTIDFLGLWETFYNPDFKPIEFDGFRNACGSNRLQLKC